MKGNWVKVRDALHPLQSDSDRKAPLMIRLNMWHGWLEYFQDPSQHMAACSNLYNLSMYINTSCLESLSGITFTSTTKH